MSKRDCREPDGEAEVGSDAPRSRAGRHSPFEDLTPASRSRVVSQVLANTADRLREVLAAAAGEDREAAARLAAGLAGDARAAGMDELRDAAAALAESAASGAPLGAPALALARAHQSAREVLRRDARTGQSP